MERKRRQPCWGLIGPQLPTEDSVSLCSVCTGESTGWSPGRSSVTPSLAMLGLPLASVLAPFLSSVLCPLPHTHTHTHTHTQTASHWQPHQSGNTKCYSCLLKSRMSFPPGIKSQSKNGASERGGGEEERTAQTEPHLAASCSALCQIETEASCTLCRHTHVHTHTYTHTHTQIWSVL